MLRTLTCMTLAALASAGGDALMSRGMKQVGDVAAGGFAAGRLFSMFANPWVWAAILCWAGFFFLYSATLSWADLSLAQPMNALAMVFTALLARVVLGEAVTPWRWGAIALIAAGVLALSLEPAKTL